MLQTDSTAPYFELGSYGALPLCVKHAISELETEIELAPDRFIRLRYPGLLKKARERIAEMIGASLIQRTYRYVSASVSHRMLCKWEGSNALS